MKLIIYSTSDDTRKVGKSKKVVRTLNNVTLKDDTSIINPIFRINNIGVEKLVKGNYCYCDALKRYYYINDMTLTKGGIIELRCTVDVLDSFLSGIKNITTLVERQENKNNAYIVDNELPVRIERQQDIKKIGTVGNTVSYVITTTGGD